MGVKSCNRNGCENIMCDRYSSKYGYLCNSCYIEYIESTSDISISEFMNSTVTLTSNEIEERNDLFDQEFKLY
jgi:hypothetical protein